MTGTYGLLYYMSLISAIPQEALLMPPPLCQHISSLYEPLLATKEMEDKFKRNLLASPQKVVGQTCAYNLSEERKISKLANLLRAHNTLEQKK